MAEEHIDHVQLATRIPRAVHRRLKLHCVKADTSVMDFVVGAITKALDQASKESKAAKSKVAG